MKMTFSRIALATVIMASSILPACRSSRKPATPPGPTVTTNPAPDVPVTVPQTSERVVEAQPRDFVQETPRPTEEELPRDIEQLNRMAQDRGLIRDAFFGYDESTLSSAAQAALTASAEWLRRNPGYNLLIEGHCDERGTEQYNLALGDRRAAIVRDYLITLGVDAGRIRTVSYGEERPFDPGHEESAWAKNRRAHLVLVGTTR